MNKVLSKWYVFLIWLVISFFVSSWIIDLRTNFKDEEVISIFISAYSFDEEKIKEELTKVEVVGIKQVNIKCVQTNNPNYYLSYSTFGVESSDFLILKKNMFGDDALKQFYSLEAFNFEYDILYFIDDKPYGIYIHKKDGESTNNNISYEETDYILLINPASKHIKDKELLVRYIEIILENVC